MLLLKDSTIEVIDAFYTDSISDFEVVKMANLIIIVNGNQLIGCESIEEFIGYFRK